MMEIHVTNLGLKRRYAASFVLGSRKRHEPLTCTYLKEKIAHVIRRDVSRIDIVNMADGVVYNDGHIFPEQYFISIKIAIRPRTRNIPEHISTDEIDMINGKLEDDECVMMSCGHAITPENLYNYCWSLLSQGRLQFTCPYVTDVDHTQVSTCGVVWSKLELEVKAILSEDERMLLDMKLNYNLTNGNKIVQSCPTCGTLCERLSERNNKVVCQYCLLSGKNVQQFCWQCLHPWRTDSNGFCGNRLCVTAKGQKVLQDILSTCKRKDFDGYVACPTTRVCPKCTTLLEHDSGCKHMTCNCGYQFCFVCLGTWERVCNHFINCQTASVQII